MSIPEELKDYAKRLGLQHSETLAKIFAVLYPDPKSRRIVKALPGTVAEISERTGFTEGETRRLVEELKFRGAIHRILEKSDYYDVYHGWVQLRDGCAQIPGVKKEFFQLWDQVMSEDLSPLYSYIKTKDIPAMGRIIPIEQTVQPESMIIDVDSARAIFKDAELVTALPCVCRQQNEAVGKRPDDCPAPYPNLCLQMGSFAKEVFERGIIDAGVAERLSNKEALKRIGDAEDAGLVHSVRNNLGKDTFLCNCCECCCVIFHSIHAFDYPQGLAPSRFQVKVDSQRCTGCGLCEERCYFHALKVEDIVVVDLDKCYGCGSCVQVCPSDALSLEEVRSKESVRRT